MEKEPSDDLLTRLQEPLTAGMFLNMSALVSTMDAQRKEAAERIAELEGLLKEARTDLEHYVDNDWPEKERAAYPSCQHKYKRDMELCYRIDAALGKKK